MLAKRCLAAASLIVWTSFVGVVLARPAGQPAQSPFHYLPTLTAGEEPIVVSQHTIQTAKGPLTYEARIGPRRSSTCTGWDRGGSTRIT
jgi:hypothetical protein